MNKVMFSSKDMTWCTPQDFFDELDKEFHFDLDPACTEKSAKCKRFFTPEDNGLLQKWGGIASSVTRRMVELFETGFAKDTRKAETRTRLSVC